MTPPTDPLLPTGEFSRRTGLSLKALRIYDQLGLFKPVSVQPGSGRQPPAGPFILIFHGVVDHESDGPIEAVLGCPPGTEPTDLSRPRSSLSCREVYVTDPATIGPDEIACDIAFPLG